MKNEETIVISVGGSLIAPEQLDVTFLKKFKTFVLKQVKLGRHFVIITGGGKTARHYQDAARNAGNLVPEDLDWLGIHATRLNGHLLRAVFRDVAYPKLVKSPSKKPNTKKPVIIAAGWKPGWSTDYVAVRIAKNLGARRVVNLSNIDHAYDKDPRTHKNARPITTADWHTFRALLPDHWDPGLSAPFDPIAARAAHKAGMEIAIINGSRLAQVAHYLNHKPFLGTLVQ